MMLGTPLSQLKNTETGKSEIKQEENIRSVRRIAIESIVKFISW